MNQAKIQEFLSYDPGTGEFHWRVSRGRVKAGDLAGSVSKANGYRSIKLFGRDYRANRLAWFYMTGDWPADEVDHRNTIRDDDRWENLREASRIENGCNRPKQSNNTSGRKGVFRHMGTRRWRAQIGINGRQIHLGNFDTAEEAAAAYAAASTQYHGEFARTEQ